MEEAWSRQVAFNCISQADEKATNQTQLAASTRGKSKAGRPDPVPVTQIEKNISTLIPK